jgi:hypothetical protein
MVLHNDDGAEFLMFILKQMAALRYLNNEKIIAVISYYEQIVSVILMLLVHLKFFLIRYNWLTGLFKK